MTGDGMMGKDRCEQLLGILDDLVEDGEDLSSALRLLEGMSGVTDQEWIEIQAVVGCASDYEYFSANSIEDETAAIQTPDGAWSQVYRWEEFVEEHEDAMDRTRSYKDTIDVARGMSDLW